MYPGRWVLPDAGDQVDTLKALTVWAGHGEVNGMATVAWG